MVYISRYFSTSLINISEDDLAYETNHQNNIDDLFWYIYNYQNGWQKKNAEILGTRWILVLTAHPTCATQKQLI